MFSVGKVQNSDWLSLNWKKKIELSDNKYLDKIDLMILGFFFFELKLLYAVVMHQHGLLCNGYVCIPVLSLLVDMNYGNDNLLWKQ